MTRTFDVDGTAIAFRHSPGSGPAVVFLPGYMSDMAGGKACAVFDHCVNAGCECLLLDYSGCGESGGAFADGTLSRWRDEVLALIAAQVRAKRVVLVGSSMGGWLMLLVGRALGDRLAGLVGIAAAPDFTDWGYAEQQKARLRAGQTLLQDNPYGPDPTPTHAKFWADGEANRQLTGEVPLTCPVRLLHGDRDAEVPPEVSFRLAKALRSEDVQVTIVMGGDHRLSREGDIALLLRTVDSLVKELPMFSLLLALAQQGAAAPPTLEQDRLTACMAEARADPARAITTATAWLEGLSGAATSAPQQCLGFAYVAQQRWDAAMLAFQTARDARPADDRLGRARLGAMVGNAALQARQPLVAEGAFAMALDDALAGGDAPLAGLAAADRARALVALDDAPAAATALTRARELAPQQAEVWLLSATLARRSEDLANARAWIATAATLAPQDDAVELETGLIAAMAGDDAAARVAWNAVIARGGPQADRARQFLAQLEQAPATP